MPKVSFIVPVYNAAPYLRDCVGSILAQTNANLEVILVNDGSTDESPSICRDFAAKDPRVKVISQQNGGLSRARNAGLDHVSGAYVTFVDADDMVHPKYAEYLLDAIESTGADAACCGMARGTECNWPSMPAIQAEKVSADKVMELSLYQQRVNSGVGGKMYRADAFVAVRFKGGILYEDLEIFSRLCLGMAWWAILDQDLYFYRQNPSSLLHTFGPQRLDVLRVVDALEKRMAGVPSLALAARDRKFAANFNMFILCSLDGSPQMAEAAKECWRTIKSYRREVLFNPKSRRKNRLGAALSYLGPKITMAVAKYIAK